ncbi:hypothetical protein BsWGS_16938 [Bradybaena similaris]
MSAAKDGREASKKPTSEAKRFLQNDQEKQRKEKIKTCIGEIAKELPPSADHLDRKPSTLSIVSQAKEYIKKLKEQNHAYEHNLAAEQQQEELKRLRELQSEHVEKIKKLEETLKTFALEKVLKSKSSDDNSSAASTDRDSPTGRRRPKTINKLLEKERNDQLLASHSDLHSMDGALSLLGSNFGHHGNSSSLGGGSNNSSSLPPSSLVLPVPSSGISIMTVAPTILSVKSPSLGQTRNQQTSRSISTSSVVGSGSSSRISSSASLVSYLDVMGGDYSDSVNGLGNSLMDGAQTNLVYSTSTASSASSSVMAAGSGSVVTAADLVGLQQQLQNTGGGGGSSGGMIGSMQGADISIIHHQQQPLMGISQQQDGQGSTSALQTLASVATSSHLSGLSSAALASGQQVGAAGGLMGLSVGLGGGLSAVSLGQLQQQQQQPSIMTLSHTDAGPALSQITWSSFKDRKQVLFNGQILTLTEPGLLSSQQQADADCQNSLQSSMCQQAGLSVGAGAGLQQSGINVGGLLGHGGFSGGPLAGGPLGPSGHSQASIIYTINEQGQLVPLQTPVNPLQQAPPGLEFMTGAGGNIITNFQNASAGGASLIPSSVQHQAQSNFLGQPPIMSIAGGQGSGQPFTILPPNAGNPLQTQVIPGSSFLMAQQFPQQQQVLNLASFGGLQVVNPFTGMIVNNLGTTLNGATVKLVGNELKLVQPGESSSGAQGPTHVMVDGSLIPISTNPQTIVPSPASLSTMGQKAQSLPLPGNPILQFDPMNPNAPPIIINGPATSLHMGPQVLGPGPLYSPAMTGAPGILHMSSSGSLGSSIPFQLGSSSGLVVASNMVTGTVTTNSVSACISSPSVSTASKGGKSLPTLAPALSQTSPTINSTLATNCGYQTILPSGASQQFIISGQKVVTAKLATPSAVMSKSAAHNRKRSPSAARASPIVSADVSSHLIQQQQIFSASGTAVIQASSKYSPVTDKTPKSKQSKHNSLQQMHHHHQQQPQLEDDKRLVNIQKKDLLAQATATAGILMDGDSVALNISAGSNMNLSGSSTELQISLKQSPRDEEDDNVQLIIDENCVSGVSSTSPAHSSFSPNMMLSSALSVSTTSSVFSHDISLGSAASQHLHIQPSSGDLTTPLVSPNIPLAASVSQAQKQPPNSSVMNMSTPQLLSPLSSNILTASSTSGMVTPSSNSELQIVAGPFRPEDVFAQLSNAMGGADTKVGINPDAGNKLNPLSTFGVSTSLPLSLSSTSPVPKVYIPIAPAPIKGSPISTALTFAQDAPVFTFADSMGNAAGLPEKPAAKGKCRGKKATPITATVTALQLNSMDIGNCALQTLQQEPKKKPPSKKRKTKAELRLEKEEKEKLIREEEARKKEAEEHEKKIMEEDVKSKENNYHEGVDDSLLPVLEMNGNEAVKEQILHSVSASKLLTTDGSQISLMDMVEKMDIFNSETGADHVFCTGNSNSDIASNAQKPGEQSLNICQVKDDDKNNKREVPRKRKTEATNSSIPKVDNKRTKKSKTMDAVKLVEGVMFNVNSISASSTGNSSSDIYDFVGDEDEADNFLQPPPTPTKLQAKKVANPRKGKAAKGVTVDSVCEVRPGGTATTRNECKITGSNSTSQPHEQPTDSPASVKLTATTTIGLSASTATTSASLPLSSPSLLSMPPLSKSPPLFSSTPAKSSQMTVVGVPSSAAIAVSNSSYAVDSNRNVSVVNSSNLSCISKKDGSEATLHSTLDESFSIEFPVMDFQTSPKLSETHDDHENSMGLPAETLADLFNQHSPGKMILNSSPPMLQNGVLSPSDVDLPALRTPAPPMNHGHSEPVLMLASRSSQELISSAQSGKQSLSHMQTPPHLEPKSPVSSLSENISTSSSAPSLSLTTTTSSSVAALPVTLSANSNKTPTSCMNSSTAFHHLDPTASPRTSSHLESQLPSLSSSSLDALSEILPLKPITAELEAEDSVNNSCAQQQRRLTPVQSQPLSHVPLNADLGMGIPQQNAQQQQTILPDLKQKQQQQQQQQPRQNQSHHPPQSSPHNLRPPSASTTPLPSPKLHASPGSASNAGSVHSVSPGTQQHSCQKQQQNSHMGSNPMLDRVNAPPLSHPPQQSPSLSQLFSPPDTSPRNSTFTSPPSGSSMKLKHMSPSNAQSSQEQTSSFISTQKGGSFSQASAQQPKNQYSVDKIIEHPNNTSSSVQSRHPSDSFNFTNIGSNVTTTTAIPSSGTMPLTSNPSGSGFSFSLSSTNQHQSSCSANINSSNNNSNNGSVSSMQSALPPSGAHVSHNTSYLNPFFAPPPPMNLPSASTSSSHHSLAMHPLGNMEIQHPTSRPSSGGSTAATYGIGPSSLMTFGSHPKLDIPPISKSPTYNTNNQSSNNNPSSSNSNNTVNTGKSPSAGSSSSSSGSYSHSSSKQAIDANSSRYQTSKSTAESIYQQQQKRPNTIQHPPAGMSHMDSMARLSSSAHNNSFFPMGFPTSSTASLSSASMPLRHLPDTRDISSRSPYDYPPVPHHPAMGFAHPHSQLSSGYGAHPSFARDCARLEVSHHQQQQQQQQSQHQQQQQSPRKQTTPKKSSTSSSIGSSSNTGSSNANSGSSSSSSNNSSHRGSGGSSGSATGSSGMGQDHSHSPAASSSRVTPSQHHSSQQQNTGSSSTNSSSHNRSSSSAQKRKATSSSSSKKKSTASQHTGFAVDGMDANMSQSMFDSSFPYLNFPTLAQSMSPPAARPHQADTPFLGGMFNTQPRPIANTSAKTADMTASHFPLFPTRAQNSFFQPTGFGMNSMTGNHGNPTAGISPHSMAVPPHMSAFGLFGNDATGAPDNISSNKFLHTNPILPGGHQTMDHSLQHGHQAAASLYHSRPHSAQSHMMAAFYQHGFDTRSHMGQPFNGSMGPPPFHTPGLPPINFSMHDTH